LLWSNDEQAGIIVIRELAISATNVVRVTDRHVKLETLIVACARATACRRPGEALAERGEHGRLSRATTDRQHVVSPDESIVRDRIARRNE
jgi:hypothetical protein